MATKGHAEVRGRGEARIFGVLILFGGGVYTRTGHIFHQAMKALSTCFKVVLVISASFALTTIAQPACVPPPAGLVSWWQGESNAVDSVGINSGALVGAVSFAPGWVGQAFSFGGAGYISIPASSNLNFSGHMPMSVETWVYRTGSASTMHILGKRAGCSGGSIQYQMSFDPTSGLTFIGDFGGPWVNTHQTLTRNTWQHLAVSYDGTSFIFYINGNAVTNVTGWLGPTNTEPLKIGNSGTCAGFVGLIDEVSIYSRAITAAEVQAIYNAGSAGKCTMPVSPVTTAPTNLTVCAGSPAIFSVTTTGGGLSYQWQVSGDGGITFTDISGTATNASYTNMAPTLAHNGNQYQVVVSANGGSVTSSPPAVLTVNAPATASAGGNQTVCAGNSTLGLGGSVGGGATGGTWSSSGTGSFLPNATTLNAAYAPSAADITVGTVTLALISTSQPPPCVATAQLVVTLQTPPAVVSPPTNLTVNAGSLPVFSVGATGAGLTYQWQVSQDGGTTFTNIGNTATNASYTNAASTLADSGNRYRVVVSGACAPPATSSPPAVLTVNPPAQASLGTRALLEGPGAGSDSVVVAAVTRTNTWTATANDAWLHLDGANQSGTGSTNVVFSYDANPDATRTGTLTIAGQTLTVTQAGSTYIAAPAPVTTLVGSGLSNPYRVAVDGAGNVFIADTGNSAIKKWTATNNSVSTLVAAGLNQPKDVAVDSAGNVFIADSGNNAIKKWTATNNSVTTLVAAGLNEPCGVAVDSAGNVYITDYITVVKKWTATNNSVTTLAAVGTGGGVFVVQGLAVDGAGNLYMSGDWESLTGWYSRSALVMRMAANNSETTLTSALSMSSGEVAVDGAGNVYVADTYSYRNGSYQNAIEKWTAASGFFTTLVSGSGLNRPKGVAVDSSGNVYIADTSNNAIKELPRAFVDPTAKWESGAAGSDVLPVVLPATANLLAPFAPTSDQPWLTITGITNGVVSFAFGANTGSTHRTAYITLLGQPIAITQTAGATQPAQLTVCAGSPAIFSTATTGEDLTYQWQVSRDGGITFTNLSDIATNASYTNFAPTLADNGNAYQVIVTWGGGALTSAPPSVLTVNPATTANAGGNQTICAGSATAALGGRAGGGATGGTWASSGTGSFAPNATTLNASYSPSAADITAGTVTLTLSSTGQLAPCGPATAQVVVTINPSPTANAGPSQVLPTLASTVQLAGSVGNGATGGTWSGGSGTFSPNASSLNAVYTPSAIEVAAGSWALTLTADPNPCGAGSSTMNFSYLPGNDLPVNTNTSTLPVSFCVNPSVATFSSAGNLSLGMQCQSGTNQMMGDMLLQFDDLGHPTQVALEDFHFTAVGSCTLAYYWPPEIYYTMFYWGYTEPEYATATIGTVEQPITFSNTYPQTAAPFPIAADGSFTLTNVPVSVSGMALYSETGQGGVMPANYIDLGAHRTLTVTGNVQVTNEVTTVHLDFSTLETFRQSWNMTYDFGGGQVTYPFGITGYVTFHSLVDATGPIAAPRYMVWNNGASTGSWNTNDANWNNGSASWNNSRPLDGAVFAGTGVGTVNLTQPIIASSLQFSSPGYTIAGSSLSLQNQCAITNDADAVVSAEIVSGSLSKWGAGRLTLSGENTYSGPTMVNGGTLLINGSLAAASVVTVQPNATLCGNGVMGGPVTVQTGATLAPGSGGIGTISIINSLSLAGTTVMELNRTNSPTCDRATGISTLTSGGALTVVNLGPDLRAGDTFTLFRATNHSGAFTTLSLPALNPGLAWADRLAVDGSISITPAITGKPASATVCAGSPATFTVTVPGDNLAYQWQVSRDGGNTFTNISATATNASYTNMAPTAADNGNQFQVVVSGGGVSVISTPPAVLTVNAPATASAGGNQTICTGSATAALGGTVGGSATGGTWSSSGTGTFAPNPTTLNATYTPSAADITAGTASLTLSTTGQPSPCGPATARVVVTINPLAAASAGSNQTICAGSATAGLGGTVGGGATGSTWSSSGTGSFAPNATTLNASYNPSAADITVGTVTLTLRAQPCSAAPARVIVTINPAATASASGNQTICAGNPSAVLGGTVGGGATGGTWSSSGTGNFAPNATALSATYSPSAADIAAGTVTLTLSTAGQLAPCGPATAQVVVTIKPAATASVAAHQTICAGSVTASLGGTVGGGATGGAWSSSGSGNFAPNPTALSATYSPSAADIAAGTVTLTLSTTGQLAPCGPATAQVVVTIKPAATASAGANQAICAGASTAALGGTVGGGATGGIWTSAGTGSFEPDATTLNATYTPSAADIAAGTVSLTLSSTGQQSPCGPARAQVVVTVHPAALGTTELWEGPGASNDSVVLAVNPASTTWAAAANAGWLHLSVANRSGTGSTNVVFSCDANPGGTRIGTLTIAGQTLTVTQAGSSYAGAPGPVTTLVASGLIYPAGVAVDSTGNVYIADYGNNAVKKWTVANNTVTTLIASGLSYPMGVAVDGAGNAFIADTYNNAIKQWTAASNTVTTLVSAGLSSPWGLAVDNAGNVYIADSGNNAIKKWTAANHSVTTLVAVGLSLPKGVAVDGAGNVYIADYGNNAIKEWSAANNTVTTVTATGLNRPRGVALDGAGNVYIADTANNVIKKWTMANNAVTTIVASGLNQVMGVAVDGVGNVYIADSYHNAIKELPHAFMDPTVKWEEPAAGNDVLPVVLPATVNLLAPFAPTSDQAWLTITGITNGVLSFAFSANPGGTNRSANITLLGQPIAITQAGLGPTLVGSTLLGNGMFQFAFSNNDLGASFTVLTTTNLSLPMSNWTVAGPATNTAPGLFQFSTGTTNTPQGFYRVRSP
jgi:autotransporter-associated beta strand protein